MLGIEALWPLHSTYGSPGSTWLAAEGDKMLAETDPGLKCNRHSWSSYALWLCVCGLVLRSEVNKLPVVFRECVNVHVPQVLLFRNVCVCAINLRCLPQIPGSRV